MLREKQKQMNSNIEQIYYINLDKRTDRNEHIVNKVLPWLKAEKDIIQRISAVDTTNFPTSHLRTTGCTLSHLKVFDNVLNNNYKYFIVIEDDFTPIISSSEFETRINKLFTDFLDFDVCQIAYNDRCGGSVKKIDNIFMTGKNIQTTCGYIMNIDFCKKIKPVFENSVKMLQEGGKGSQYAVDQVWKPYQKFDRWLLTKCGKQLSGFSDIEKRNTNYQC